MNATATVDAAATIWLEVTAEHTSPIDAMPMASSESPVKTDARCFMPSPPCSMAVTG